MLPEIIEFLMSKRVGVVAVKMPDGTPHAATVHYVFVPDSSTFIIQTNPSSRKGEAVLSSEETAVSFVVGTEEAGGKEKTFQLNGVTRVLKDADEIYKKLYFEKFPQKQSMKIFANDIFFIFTPTWWRFTDWSKQEGKTIFNSDGTVVVARKNISQ